MVKPLWTEIMELMGGEFRQMRNDLYKETDGDASSNDSGGGSSSSLLG